MSRCAYTVQLKEDYDSKIRFEMKRKAPDTAGGAVSRTTSGASAGATGSSADASAAAVTASSKPAAPKRTKSEPSPHSGPIEFEPSEHKPAASFEACASAIAAAVDGDFKVVSWNCNGIRSALDAKRKTGVLAWLKAEAPDVLALQEIRIDGALVESFRHALAPQLPHVLFACSSSKGYAGTAIFSRNKPLRTLVGDFDTDGRITAAEFDRIWVVNVYVPNSGMKLERLEERTKVWDPALRSFLAKLRAEAAAAGKRVLLVGDMNVAFRDCDVHDPKTNRNKTPGFCDAERDGLAALLADGWVDAWVAANPSRQQFTYWSARFSARDKNKGWRLDYILPCADLAAAVKHVFVRSDFPGTDHVPIGCILDLNAGAAASSAGALPAAASAPAVGGAGSSSGSI